MRTTPAFKKTPPFTTPHVRARCPLRLFQSSSSPLVPSRTARNRASRGSDWVSREIPAAGGKRERENRWSRHAKDVGPRDGRFCPRAGTIESPPGAEPSFRAPPGLSGPPAVPCRRGRREREAKATGGERKGKEERERGMCSPRRRSAVSQVIRCPAHAAGPRARRWPEAVPS